MLIICEGIDKSGKSTFVKLLEEQLSGAVVLRFGPPEPGEDPFEQYERSLYEHLDTGRPVLCDRHAWSERAYGPALRGRQRLRESGWRHVELFLATHGAVVVYLHQPTSVLRERLRALGDDLVGEEHLLPVALGYQWCLRHTVLPTIALRDPGRREARYVVDLAQWYSRHPRSTTLVGPLRPEVLLLGEVRNGTDDRSAFTPRGSSSGHYLLNCLPERLWPHVALANACDVDDPVGTWEELDRPAVVTLGHEAHVTLVDLGVPHAAVPHPQFVRRFYHHQLSAYGRLIEEVAGTTRDELQWKG